MLENFLAPEFTNRLEALFLDPILLKSVLESFQVRKPITVRFNPLANYSKETTLSELNKLELDLTQVSWYQDAWLVTTPDNINIAKSLESSQAWQAGALYRQNFSSMIPPVVLNPQLGDQVLDLAAAPGSKTTQLAALMENSGLILANDTSYERLFKLKANLLRLKVTNTTVQQSMGQTIWKNFPHIFDKVLADVPCSMEGRILATKPETYEHWSEKQLKTLAERQVWLLRSAISATKPGGVVVYSTCTLSPEENECVVDAAIKKSKKEKITIEPIQLFSKILEDSKTLPTSLLGITSWRGKDLHPDLKNTLRIAPSLWYEGFFVAKLRIN